MIQTPSSPLARLSPYHRARLLLSFATIVSLALFYAAARLLHIPPAPTYPISLLQQPSPLVALIVVLVLLILSTILASIIAGSIRQDAGLAAAALGLVAITARGGTITASLQSATSSSVYSSLAVETALLYAFLLLAWFALAPLRASHYLLPDHHHDGVSPPSARAREEVDEPIGNKLLATAATTLGTLILLLVLAQTADKTQSLAAVFFATFLATAAAHSAFPVRSSPWYWIAPGVVAIIGYAYASASPGPWLIGQPATPLSAPLPLDYAACGPAGALLGYYTSRKWQHARENPLTPPNPPTPPMTDAHMPMG